MKLKKGNIILLFTFLTMGIQFYAQENAKNAGKEKKHVHWRSYFEPSKTNLAEGTLVFEAEIDSGWQMFAQNQLPQLPVGIEIMIRQSGNFTLSGFLSGPLPEIAYSHTYDKPVAVYTGIIKFKQKIILKSQTEFGVKTSVEHEETSSAEEIVYCKTDLVVNVKPSKGVRLKFL